MALTQILPNEKQYKPSKLETFAKMMDLASSIGSMAGNVYGMANPVPAAKPYVPKTGYSIMSPLEMYSGLTGRK